MTAIASRSQLRMSFLRHALVTVPLILLLGVASGRVANSGYGNPWFDALVKPAQMPPGWAFAVVWPILYVLMGLALAMILHARGAKGRPPAIALFCVQLVLNLLWSPIFFAWHLVGLALGIISAMVVLVLVTTVLFAGIRRGAAALMLPYLAWLCFAAFLNYQIMQLNPGGVAPGSDSTDITL
jgi:tryptophan-rich sensory protein